jgi:hypothetical protein
VVRPDPQGRWRRYGLLSYELSYKQCMTTLSGIGGYCYQSPYYLAAADKARSPFSGSPLSKTWRLASV